MRYIDYDFSDFERIMFNLKINPSPSLLVQLKNELNSFFRDSKCKEVIYTNNTDKMFFGMAVMPIMKADDVYDILQSHEPYRITEYYLELDSKLFKPTLNMSARELVAIILHEVGHMVKDNAPMDEVRKNIDLYLMQNKDTITMTDSIHYKEILLFGIKDALRKVTSIFETDESEFIADEFVVGCGYGAELESALNKIVNNSYNINKDVDNKIIVLSWTLRLYKDVKLRRISAIRSMRRGKELTPSKLEKKEMDNVIRRLERIDDDALIESVYDDISAKYTAAVKQMKYKGIRGFEDDLYEYSLRSQNLETEADALLLLNQINTRMSIIDDYITSEDLSEAERKRWFNLYDKYVKLRDDMAKKSIYQNRTRLYINYPVNY